MEAVPLQAGSTATPTRAAAWNSAASVAQCERFSRSKSPTMPTRRRIIDAGYQAARRRQRSRPRRQRWAPCCSPARGDPATPAHLPSRPRVCWASHMQSAAGPHTSAEPALEQLLLRIVPGLAAAWHGASDAELSRIQSIAGRPLPAFYHWFMQRLGKSLGPMAYPGVDFTAQGLLAAYAAGRIAPDRRYLLIGYDHDDVSPLHYFYDLDAPVRGDALVVRMSTPSEESHEQFETLREMLAWGELYTHGVAAAAQQCRGVLRYSGGSLAAALQPALGELGFQEPLE